MQPTSGFHFAPELFIPNGVTNIDFYAHALGAVELLKWLNDDGSIHVAELQIGEAIFHLHEANTVKQQISPAQAGCITTTIGLFVNDVYAVIEKALAAGAELVDPVQDHDYGYWQASIKDAFGHTWQIQQKI